MLAFERYRLSIVSIWPENDEKQQTIRSIETKIYRLEMETESQREH
jgi:hypothetical protein